MAVFIPDICSINLFKKYLFGLIVASYLATIIGIPVYLHYCGGELEEVSYLTRATSCCGEEEDQTEDNGCCKNESHVLLNAADFTLNNVSSALPLKSYTELFYLATPFALHSFDKKIESFEQFIESPPPRLQHDRMLASTLLRI